MKSKISVLSLSLLGLSLSAFAIGQNPQPKCIGGGPGVKCGGTSVVGKIPLGLGFCENESSDGRRGYHAQLLLLGPGKVQVTLYNGGFDYERARISPPPGKPNVDEAMNGQQVFQTSFMPTVSSGQITLVTPELDEGSKLQLTPLPPSEQGGKGTRYRGVIRIGAVSQHQSIQLNCQLYDSVVALINGPIVKTASSSQAGVQPAVEGESQDTRSVAGASEPAAGASGEAPGSPGSASPAQ